MELLLPLFFVIPFAIIGVTFGVWIWALVDALQVPADVFYRSGSKILWGILIGVMGPIAAIVYFAAGRPDAATRQWLAQQREAGVDLRVYRVYDQPAMGGWGPRRPYGAPPAPPYGPAVNDPTSGYGHVAPSPGPPPAPGAPPPPWPPS